MLLLSTPASCGGEASSVGIYTLNVTRIHFATSKKVKGPRGVSRWECNLAAVWGQMTTGGGHTSLSNTMSVLGVPVMSKGSYTAFTSMVGTFNFFYVTTPYRYIGKEGRVYSTVPIPNKLGVANTMCFLCLHLG